MKNKKVLVAVFILFIAVVVIIYLNQTKVERWKKLAEEHLKTDYQGKFVWVHSEEKDSKIIFTYVTDDENQIEFQVKCWWGKENTPWGEIPLTRKRYIIDDFEEKICEFSVSEKECYDVTGKNIEEIIQLIKNKYEIAKNYYDIYGMASYRKPEIYMNLRREENYATIAYGGAEAFLHDKIMHKLIIPKKQEQNNMH